MEEEEVLLADEVIVGELEEDESEWPSLKLDAKEVVSLNEAEVALEEDEESLVDEVIVGGLEEDESKWPSLKLNASEALSFDSSIATDAAPSSDVIPGLSTTSSSTTNNEFPPKSDQESDQVNSNESESSLGELRFKD